MWPRVYMGCVCVPHVAPWPGRNAVVLVPGEGQTLGASSGSYGQATHHRPWTTRILVDTRKPSPPHKIAGGEWEARHGAPGLDNTTDPPGETAATQGQLGRTSATAPMPVQANI